MWLNRIVCLILGHIPKARLKLDYASQRMVGYWECDRCGKELEDE